MRIYLSAVFENLLGKYNNIIENETSYFEELFKDTHILLSYAYAKKEYIPYYSMCKSLLMDSGAFTIMNSKAGRNNFNPLEYTKQYGKHIKEHNIENFLELDIDGVYGFEVYRDCLYCLQDITGRQPIPVFHKWRGIDYYKELVKKYDYIAIGDVSIGAGSRELYKYFPWFLEEAHKNNCKVHGLAFTSLPDLRFMPFDSVDSSSWTAGSRFARPVLFDGHTGIQFDARRTNEKQLCHNKMVFLHDFIEWKKLAVYMDNEYEPIWK